jgi:hypothetical protein
VAEGTGGAVKKPLIFSAPKRPLEVRCEEGSKEIDLREWARQYVAAVAEVDATLHIDAEAA